MEKQVILVTGSSGRIGKRLVERLNAQTTQPVGLDFVGTISPTPAMEFIFADLSSDKSIEVAFERVKYAYGSKITSIIHLAAFYSFAGTHLENYEKITVRGTERLLNEAKKVDVEQFIFTSTMLVHNPTKRGVIITEDDPIVGKWHYPASKVRTEHLIHEKRGNIPTVILRIAGCYDDECNCIPISQNLVRVYEKQFAGYFFPGKSENGVPYIHFDDLVDMLLMCVEQRKTLPPEVTLLAAEEDSISYRDLQNTFGQLLYHKNWPMIWLPKMAAKFGAWVQGLNPFGPPPFIKPWMVDLADDNYEVSVAKAKKVLGWAPKRHLRETLPKIVANFKAAPIAWYKRHGIPLSGKVKREKK